MNTDHEAATGNHIAGEPADLVQRCIICGGIIQDNRPKPGCVQAQPLEQIDAAQARGEDPWAPLFWEAGPIHIIRDGGCTQTGIGHSEDLPDCEP